MMLLCISCGSYKDMNKTRETMYGEILYGKINKSDMQKEPFASWFNEDYETYKPDFNHIDQIKEYMNNVSEVVIIMGSWCPDTRRELPIMMKILDEVNFPEADTKIYAVDRNKKNGLKELRNHKFERIPTFIFYDGSNEIGRIVEKVQTTTEEELLELLRNYFEK